MLARHQKCIDQVGDLDLAPQPAEFAIQELQVELGVVTDDHHVL